MVVKKNVDGSIDVWYRGWRVSFPPGGGRPNLERQEAPDDLTSASGSAAKLDEGTSHSYINCGKWQLIFRNESDEEPHVEPIEPPDSDDGSGGFFYRVFPSGYFGE